MSGRAMQRHLEAMGLCAQKIVQKRDTGHYVAEFFIPGMKEPVESSVIWAGRICGMLPDVVIIQTHDTCAQWREDCPVIVATVVFDFSDRFAA